jgi:hypothetical protein
LRIFIWKYVPDITAREHNGGGLLVVAKDLERANALLETEPIYEFDSWHADDKSNIVGYVGARSNPDFIFNTDETEERVLLFPDAGCC